MSQLGQLETFPALSRMSEVGVRADVARRWLGLLLLATSGNWHSDKTFVGRIEKGFDFFGYHLGQPGGFHRGRKDHRRAIQRLGLADFGVGRRNSAGQPDRPGP